MLKIDIGEGDLLLINGKYWDVEEIHDNGEILLYNNKSDYRLFTVEELNDVISLAGRFVHLKKEYRD